MQELKLVIEKEADLNQIKALLKSKKVEPKAKVEEKVFMKKKRIEYSDNYQYKQTKEFIVAIKDSILIPEIFRGSIL